MHTSICPIFVFLSWKMFQKVYGHLLVPHILHVTATGKPTPILIKHLHSIDLFKKANQASMVKGGGQAVAYTLHRYSHH